MKVVGLLCVVATLLFKNSGAIPVNEGKRSSLYSSEDDVVVLTHENFKARVENSSSAWVVLFYLHWCGDCQRFAPSWKALAADIFGWKDLVNVGAMDCADEINTPVCNEYEIPRYPAVKYFHENFQTGLGSVGVLVSKTDSNVESQRHHLIDRIITEINENRGVMYPNLLPYVHSDFSHLFDSLPSTIQYVFLVIEPPQSYLAVEVALDLHRTSSILIRHAFTNNSALVGNLHVEKFPRVMVIDRKNNSEILFGEINTRGQLKEVIKRFLDDKRIKLTEKIASKNNSNRISLPDNKQDPRTLLRNRIKKMGDVIFQADLEAALRYSLKQEVSTFKILRDEKLNALKAYLHVLQKYFPFSPRASSFLNELKQLTNATEIEGWRIGETVRQAEENGLFSSPQRFLACEGSFPKYRGYPCSLWKLFHYLTVNSALDSDNNKKTNSREVLDAMYGYIKYFFSCADCSQHFQDMAAKRSISDVSSLESAVLWLWEAHNEVNKRLAGDVTEDPEYPKKQFPTKELCVRCVNADDSWNTDEVLKYLKKMYGSLNVRYIGSDTKVLFLGLE